MSIVTHRIELPLRREDVAALRAGDLIKLSGEIVITAGLPTHERLREAVAGGRDLPFPLTGGTLFHLGSYSEDGPNGFQVRYMNPTTSTRFNRFMPELIAGFDLRLVGGRADSTMRVRRRCARQDVPICRSLAADASCCPPRLPRWSRSAGTI